MAKKDIVGLKRSNEKLVEIDVTYNDFCNLKSFKCQQMQLALMSLYYTWVYPWERRKTDCRMGTMNIYIDRQDNPHFDFVARFKLPDGWKDMIKKNMTDKEYKKFCKELDKQAKQNALILKRKSWKRK